MAVHILKEILSDVEEGADMVMVKPALSYLDVVRAAKEVTNVPLATYNVSGEYAMICAAAERGEPSEPSGATTAAPHPLLMIVQRPVWRLHIFTSPSKTTTPVPICPPTATSKRVPRTPSVAVGVTIE